MTRAVLFDIDGIVIVGKKHLFSQRLAEQQKVSQEAINEFFLGNFRKCSFGQADLREELVPFLSKWNWEGTVDDLLNFWFQSEGAKDEKVLEIIKNLRAKGIKCYIATRQEKYRLKYLWETIGLKDYFDGSFCTCNIGYDKKDPEFFQHVVKELNVKLEEILFFDDKQVNIDNAKSLGIEAYFYDSIDTLIKNTRNV